MPNGSPPFASSCRTAAATREAKSQSSPKGGARPHEAAGRSLPVTEPKESAKSISAMSDKQASGSGGDPVYVYKPSLMGTAWELRLRPDALEWQAGRRCGRSRVRDRRAGAALLAGARGIRGRGIGAGGAHGARARDRSLWGRGLGGRLFRRVRVAERHIFQAQPARPLSAGRRAEGAGAGIVKPAKKSSRQRYANL